MTVHKRCCYFMKPEEICKGHPVGVVWGMATLCGCGLGVAIPVCCLVVAGEEWGGGGEGGSG